MMKNQMEKKEELEMESGFIWQHTGIFLNDS